MLGLYQPLTRFTPQCVGIVLFFIIFALSLFFVCAFLEVTETRLTEFTSANRTAHPNLTLLIIMENGS